MRVVQCWSGYRSCAMDVTTTDGQVRRIQKDRNGSWILSDWPVWGVNGKNKLGKPTLYTAHIYGKNMP